MENTTWYPITGEEKPILDKPYLVTLQSKKRLEEVS